jgi:hypothetical protein
MEKKSPCQSVIVTGRASHTNIGRDMTKGLKEEGKFKSTIIMLFKDSSQLGRGASEKQNICLTIMGSYYRYDVRMLKMGAK